MASKKKRKWQKRLGKLSKAAPIVTGVGGAVIGYKYGAVAGAGFTGVSAFGARYAAGAGARGAGKRHSAKKWGDKAFKNTLIGGGAGTVAGAGVAALQAYGNTGKGNVAAGTFLGGKDNFLGISKYTQEGLDGALPSLQKMFGFTPRTLRKDRKDAEKGDYGVIKDIWGKVQDKLPGGLDKDDPENGGQGGMGNLPTGMGGFGMMEEEPSGKSNTGLLVGAGLLGLLIFMG